MLDLEGFTTHDLRVLLECQEYPDGDTAAEIRGILTWRAGRERDDCA